MIYLGPTGKILTKNGKLCSSCCSSNIGEPCSYCPTPSNTPKYIYLELIGWTVNYDCQIQAPTIKIDTLENINGIYRLTQDAINSCCWKLITNHSFGFLKQYSGSSCSGSYTTNEIWTRYINVYLGSMNYICVTIRYIWYPAGFHDICYNGNDDNTLSGSREGCFDGVNNMSLTHSPYATYTFQLPGTITIWPDYNCDGAVIWFTGTLYSIGDKVKINTDDTYCFVCYIEHTSDSTNKPYSGANWSNYWHTIDLT